MALGPSGTGEHPRAARVRQRQDFLRIQRKGIRVQSEGFVIIAAGGGVRPRLGTAVSRRVGNAVTRNRIRRLLREIFRRMAGDLPAMDVMIVAKEKAATLAKDGFDVMAADVVPAVREAATRIRTGRPEGRIRRGTTGVRGSERGAASCSDEGKVPRKTSRRRPSGS